MTEAELIEAMAEAARAESTTSLERSNVSGVFDGDVYWRDVQAAALSAIRAAGFVVVPVVPTEAMSDTGVNLMTEMGMIVCDESEAGRVYTAMLAASPMPPGVGE